MKNLSKDKMNESISSLLVQIKEMKKKNKKIEQEKNKLVIENRELKKFFDITIDLLCIADTNGYFRKLNAEWEKTLGYSLEELEGSRFLDFIHPDDIISTLDAIKELSSQKEVLNFVNRYRCKDGSYKWIEWRSKPSGEMIFAAARDITERKISETIRKETDEYNEMIFQHTPVAKVVMDENGRFLRCNEFAAKVFGYESAAELLQKTPWELSTPQQKNGKESEKYSLEIIRSILISMKPVEFEWQHKKPNGEIWDGQVYLYPFIHKDQKRLYFTIRDITVQKKTQDFQRLNEIRLEAMLKLQSMKDCDVKEITDFTLEYAVSITDSSLGYIAFLNNEQDVLTMNSWSKEAMKECAIENKPIIYPVINTGLWGEAIRQRKPIITNDYLAPNEFKKGTPKGHVNLLRHMNVPIFDGDKIVVLIGVGNKDSEYDEYDVMQLTLLTKGMWELIQRKKAEEIVQQNESRLRQIIDLVPHFIFAKNRDGKFILANKAVADTFGVSVNELLGKTDADFNPDMAMVEHFRNDDLEVIEKGKPIFIPEEKITDSKGNIKYLETTKIPFKLSETQEDVVLGTSTDITERKTSEKALLESEKLYRSVIENIQDVFYKSDKEGRLIMGSPSGGKMFGYDNIEEIIGKHLDSFWANPEKRSDLDQKMRVNGSVSDYECVMLRKDGSSFDVSLTAHFLYDEKGNILGTEGIIRDITKRKQAEEALRESEKRFREMMDFLPESIYESDVNGIITYANKTALSVFGYEESDFSKNIKITELLIPEDRERALNNRELAYKEKSRTIEYTGLRKDGSTLPVLIHTIAVFKNGQICGTRGVIIDVTEQKKAEEALRSSEEKFRSLIQNSSDVITILNSKGLIMYISPSSERVLKRKPDEMIGKSPIEYIHPEDLDLVNKALKEVY